MKKKIVVIGSGVGGAACAALLARAGHSVTLLEQHGFAGGRCASFERDGFRYDFGVHMFSRGDEGPHGEVNRLLGGDLTWVTKDPPCRVMGKLEFDFPLDIRPLWRQVSVAANLGVKPRSLYGCYRLFRLLMSGRSVEENDHVSLKDFIERYTDDENVHLFLNCLCQLYFALSYRDASAGEFIWSFARMFSEASFGYPAGAGGAIPESFVRSLVKHGGTVRYKEAVKSIIIKKGSVAGVKTARATYPADIVISNAGMARTIDLAGKKNFPVEYVKKAEGCIFANPYVTIKYALNRPVIPYPVVFCMPDLPADRVFSYIDERRPPEDPYIFMPVPSNINPELAPPGKQLVIAGTAAPGGADKALSDAILDRVHERVCRLFPDFQDSILWQVRTRVGDTSAITGHPAGETIGIAQTPFQSGELRPRQDTPVRGLWLVGADAGARGIGTEMASGSAIRLAGEILRD